MKGNKELPIKKAEHGQRMTIQEEVGSIGEQIR